MRDPAPVHYLRPNDKVWTPPALIVLDTETATEPHPTFDVERLRCWTGHYFDRRVSKGVKPRDEWARGESGDELAGWVDRVTRNRETVWLYAHNLGFDLTTTRLPLRLVDAGWRINDAAVGGKAPWMRLGHGKRVLTMADSWSWLPVALEAVGQAVELPKPPLPEQGGELADWYRRCWADVAILEAALCGLMDWWDREQLGRWTISGAACGWNAYRHKQPVRHRERRVETLAGAKIKREAVALDPVVIDPDPDKITQDRLAVHGGRRATFVLGEHRAGPFLELDLTAAYPTVAAELPLPAKRMVSFDTFPVDDPRVCSDRHGILATVLVETDVPRWPVRVGRHTWYPVGTFWCDLAGPDIAEARRLGCLRKIGPGQLHQLGRNMAPWARWCLATQRGEITDTPPVARIAAKSWGRSVIGKWASHSFERVQLGPAPTDGWGYEEGWNHTDNVACGVVDLAGTRWLVSASGTPDNAYPAVLAWVESQVRVRLSRVIEALGTGCVLQADTDGLIVAQRTLGTVSAHGQLHAPPEVRGAARTQWALDRLAPLVAPLTIRVKARHGHVTVLGPQHLHVGGVRRFAGLPGMAEQTGPGEYTAKLWPKLQWQMAKGSPDGYVRPITHPKITGPYPTGWVLDSARVVPLETELDKAGANRVIPWERSAYARAGLRRADAQHPQLARFW